MGKFDLELRLNKIQFDKTTNESGLLTDIQCKNNSGNQ